MSERVLIVDDDPVQRRLLAHMLRTLGYEPAFATPAEVAIAALADAGTARIHAVLLDLAMPHCDGLGVLSRMRKAGLDLPVIVQTAPDAVDSVVAAIRAGATDFVVKPVGSERLQVSLRNALAARALERELARIKQGGSNAVVLGERDTIRVPESAQIASRVADFVPSGSVAPELTVCAAISPHARVSDGSLMVSRSGDQESSLASALIMPAAGVIALLDGNGDMRPLEEIEAETIRFAISHYRGQMSEVARRLRIGRSTLYRKLDSLALDAGLKHAEAPPL
jgi:DNA-binding NtrC family response regulator